MSTLIATFAIAVTAIASPGESCRLSAPLVEMQVDPPAIATDLTLVQIEALHAQMGDAPHKPLGAYLSSFRSDVQIVGPTPAADCQPSKFVRVNFKLTNRRIEIAREIASSDCLFNAVQTHYERHAKAEVAAFEQLIEQVGQNLRTPEVLDTLRDTATATSKIGDVVKKAIAPTIDSFKSTVRVRNREIDAESNEAMSEQMCSVMP